MSEKNRASNGLCHRKSHCFEQAHLLYVLLFQSLNNYTFSPALLHSSAAALLPLAFFPSSRCGVIKQNAPILFSFALAIKGFVPPCQCSFKNVVVGVSLFILIRSLAGFPNSAEVSTQRYDDLQDNSD